MPETQTEVFCCADCGYEIAESQDYCDDCYFERFTDCADCGDDTPRDDLCRVWHGDSVCPDCDSNYYHCADCGIAVSNDDTVGSEGGYYCPDCNGGLRFRNWQEVKLPPGRTYGVEIECLLKEPRKLEIPPCVGIKSDGSIKGRGTAVEFVTPPLCGQIGEDVVKKVCKGARLAGATINKSCGLHVHIDAKGITSKNLQKLLAFYLVYDDVIMAMLPKARRGNRYARSLKSRLTLEEVIEASNREAIEKIWYRGSDNDGIQSRKSHHYDNSRYYGINIHSLYRTNTIEIRYHSPTLNAGKILNWVRLHVLIADSISRIPLKNIIRASNLVLLDEKLKLMLRQIRADVKLTAYIEGRVNLFNSNILKRLCAE